MRILIFIVAIVMVADAYAACSIVPSKIVNCDSHPKGVQYERHEPPYNQALLCEATREKMGSLVEPDIHVVHRDLKAMFFEVLDDGEGVIARGIYNVDKEQLTGWVLVETE